MTRLISSARPYPDASSTLQRRANSAAAALRHCEEQRHLAAPGAAAAWLGVLRGARRRNGDLPCERSCYWPASVARAPVASAAARQPGACRNCGDCFACGDTVAADDVDCSRPPGQALPGRVQA